MSEDTSSESEETEENRHIYHDPDGVYDGLDRRPGSGSLSTVSARTIEHSREPSHDGRARTRTTMYRGPEDDDPSGSSTWSGLAALNDGVGSPERGERNHEADVGRRIAIVCGQLDVTGTQRDRVARSVDELGDVSDVLPTMSIEAVALGAISLVVDAETTDFEKRITKRDDFESLMSDVGIETSELWTIRQKLREETAILKGI